nr:RNA-directed DNA polymerase, eukaryota, reverse transcriptase zinc-binding domain protein [Tanacetum cinerariifolium]
MTITSYKTRLRFHANIARFDRKEGPRSYQADEKRQESIVSKPIGLDDSMPKSFVNVLRETIGDKKESNREHVGENSEIILSQEGNCEVVLAIVGCFKDIRSIMNSKIICKNEGFQGVETKYLERLIWLEVEGVPFGAWNNDSLKKHVAVVTFKGVSHVIRVRELCSWTPNFNLDDMDNEDEGSVGIHNDKDEGDSLEDVEEYSVGDISSNENEGEKQNMEHIQQDVNVTSEKETKMVRVDIWILPQVWGNSQFNFASISSRGRSGGCWMPTGLDIMFIAVYAPQSVREAGERYDSVFHERQADAFNLFIKNLNLIDIPLGGFRYTLSNKRALKMSKLDRFLVNEGVQDAFPHITGIDLEKGGPLPRLGELFFNLLSPEQRDYLECDFSNEEIKRAVWDCGGDRAPGPDSYFPKGCNSSFIALIPKVGDANFVSKFRPISLICCQYKIIGKLLANRLSRVIESCVSMAQSASIKGRNILDGPLILNGCMAWYRKRKKELLVFKVDFEKAFDYLRWDYLGVIMENLGFSFKWRTWIDGCLQNSRASVLVNGSPTAEFEIFKGLRQGDPLSPFLFILAMKGLHASICKAVDVGVFKRASIGQGVPVGGGTLTLLKSVVGNLPTYYMSLYLMPATMRKKLEVMRNRFFLGGDLRDRKRVVLRRMPKGGIKFNQFTALLEAIRDVSISKKQDRWKWSLNSKGFSVASARIHIDEHTLIGGSMSTRWPKCVPIKVNVFMWRLSLDKLATLVNMDRKGIDLASLLCPVCYECVENVNHLFSLVGCLEIFGLVWLDGVI